MKTQTAAELRRGRSKSGPSGRFQPARTVFTAAVFGRTRSLPRNFAVKRRRPLDPSRERKPKDTVERNVQSLRRLTSRVEIVLRAVA